MNNARIKTSFSKKNFTCVILTYLVAEIQKFISKQGAFPFVIVWVLQLGAWKQAPM